MTTMLDDALKLWNEGWDVVPIAPGGKRPLGKWGGRKRAKRLSRKQVEETWGKKRRVPDLGIVLGEHEAAIDLDSRTLVHELGPTLAHDTRCALTPHNGLHALFRTKEPTRPFRPAEKVDVQGHGSVIVVPPSKDRAWANDREVLTVPDIRVYVDGLLDAASIPIREHTALSPGEARLIPIHERNATLAAIAGLLRKVGFRETRLLAILRGLNRDCTEAPLPDEEIANIARKAAEYGHLPLELDTCTIEEVDPAKMPKPLDYRVEHLLPIEGMTLFFGAEGQGKSYLMVGIALAVLNNLPIFGLKTQPTGVIYVDWERRGRIFKRRLAAMAKTLGIDPRKMPHPTYITPNVPLPEMVDTLQAEIEAREARLVILDSLTISLLGAEIERTQDVGPALFRLSGLPASVAVVDHQAKLYGDESYWGKTPFGSAIKQWVFSHIWHVGKERQKEFAEDHMIFTLKHEKTNFDRKYPDIHVRIDFQYEAGGSVSRINMERTEQWKARDEIGMELQAASEPMTIPRLMEETGTSLDRVRHVLADLIQEGVVRNIAGEGRQGLYEWVGA